MYTSHFRTSQWSALYSSDGSGGNPLVGRRMMPRVGVLHGAIVQRENPAHSVSRAFGCCRSTADASGSAAASSTSPSSPVSPASSSPSLSTPSVHLDPSTAYTYKTLRALFTAEQLKDELRARDLPYLGYKTQLAGRLYQALLDEGRALVGEEAIRVDAALPDEVSDGEGEGSNALLMKETFSGVFLENDSEAVMSNKTGMQVVFLNGGGVSGGGGAGGGGNGNGSSVGDDQAILCPVSGSVGLRTLQSVILFDVGEDTQVR